MMDKKKNSQIGRFVKLTESFEFQKKKRTYDESLEILLERISNCIALSDYLSTRFVESQTYFKNFNKNSKNQETLEKKILEMIELEDKLRVLLLD
jgi:hypothetical protein